MQVRFTGPCLAPQGVDGGTGLEDLDTSLDQRHTGIHLLGPIQLVDVVFLRSHLQTLPPRCLELASQDGFRFSIRHGMHSLVGLPQVPFADVASMWSGTGVAGWFWLLHTTWGAQSGWSSSGPICRCCLHVVLNGLRRTVLASPYDMGCTVWHHSIQLYKLNCSKLIHYILRLMEFTPKIWVDRSIVVF